MDGRDTPGTHAQFNTVFERLLAALQRSFVDSKAVRDLSSRFELALTFSQALPLKRYRETVLPFRADIEAGEEVAEGLMASPALAENGLGGLQAIWGAASPASRKAILAFLRQLNKIAAA
jgi:hypothetical protein